MLCSSVCNHSSSCIPAAGLITDSLELLTLGCCTTTYGCNAVTLQSLQELALHTVFLAVLVVFILSLWSIHDYNAQLVEYAERLVLYGLAPLQISYLPLVALYHCCGITGSLKLPRERLLSFLIARFQPSPLHSESQTLPHRVLLSDH